jgi:hypothetical protein
MKPPPCPKQTFIDDLETAQVFGTTDLLKMRFKSLSISGKVHFLAGWLNNTVKPQLNKIIAALNDNEKPIVKRMHKIWQHLLSHINEKRHYTATSILRIDLENEIYASLANKNLRELPAKDKLNYYKQLLALVSKGNKVTSPNPELVKNVKLRIDEQRMLRLQSFKVKFAELTITLQQKILKLLSRQSLQPRSRLGLWVYRLRNHLLALRNGIAKEMFIDEITTLHRKKLVERFVEKPRKDLYMRWTTSQPKETSKQYIGRRLFLPDVADINVTTKPSELGLRPQSTL